MELYDRCELCREDLPEDHVAQKSVLDVCHICTHDLTHERIAHRTFALQQMRWVERGREGGSSTAYIQETVALPYPLALKATFTRETARHKLMKLFKKEPQVGDRIFDDALYLETGEPDALVELLQAEGLRIAILDAVSELGPTIGPLHLDGNVVRFRMHDRYENRGLPLLRHAALIAHHLERAAVAHDLPPEEGAVPFPDLTPFDDPERAERVRRLEYWADRLVDPAAFDVLPNLERLRIRSQPPG